MTPAVLEIAIKLMAEGKSRNVVAADYLNCSSSGLGKALARRKRIARRKTPLPETRGRTKSVKPHQRKRLLKKFEAEKTDARNPLAPAMRRKAGLVKVCGVRTVQRELVDGGDEYLPRANKSSLQPEDPPIRFEFAEEHEDSDWTQVDCLTDCKGFAMPLQEAPKRSSHCWRKAKEALLPWATKCGDARYKGPSHHIFGGFGPDRTEPTRTKKCEDQECPCDGKTYRICTHRSLFMEEYTGGKGGWSSKIATAIMDRALLPKLRTHRPKKTLQIQVDGDGAFTAAHIKRWAREKNARLFTIPPRSGDFAPIEKAWAHITKFVELAANGSRHWRYGAKDTPSNRAKWAKLVNKCVRKVTKSYWTNLGNGLHKRTQMLIASKGQKIKG